MQDMAATVPACANLAELWKGKSRMEFLVGFKAGDVREGLRVLSCFVLNTSSAS